MEEQPPAVPLSQDFGGPPQPDDPLYDELYQPMSADEAMEETEDVDTIDHQEFRGIKKTIQT